MSSPRQPFRQVPAKLTRSILQRTLRYTKARYLADPNVVAIGIGTKFTARESTGNHRSIQFFVRQKIPHQDLGVDRLPNYIIARGPKNALLRPLRIATDVISVGHVEAVCGAGARVLSLGQGGVATLMFRDKGAPHGDSFLLTCAHVVGSVHAPVARDLTSGCDLATVPFARPVAMAKVEAGTLEYDVALAKVLRPLADNEDMVLDGTSIRLRSLLSRQDVRPPARYSCRFPVSHTSNGQVASSFGTVQVTYDSADCLVENAFVLQAPILPGDSGGLIYAGNSAVGIAFARSPDGWTWFHALGDALSYAIKLYGQPIRCL